MVINTRIVENANLYTYGEWISPTLDSSLFLTPFTTDHWRFLSWDESFSVEKGTGDGYVRIDILDASDDSILIQDLYWLAEGTDFDLLSSPIPVSSGQNIKVKVKIYGLNNPTPIVKKILVRNAYGGFSQMITNIGLMTFLERGLSSAPVRTAIEKFQVGTGTTIPDVSNTALTNSVFSGNIVTSATVEDPTNLTINIKGSLDTTEGNGNAFTEAGLANSDSPALCSHEVWTTTIDKTASITVNFTWILQIQNNNFF